jgi:hypothetical protein
MVDDMMITDEHVMTWCRDAKIAGLVCEIGGARCIDGVALKHVPCEMSLVAAFSALAMSSTV